MTMQPQYNEDFYGWTQENARLLKEHKFSELDIDNLVEEIESMGKRDYRELVNLLAGLLCHLLKWHYQPRCRGSSWETSICNNRDKIELILADSKSLRNREPDFLPMAYRQGRRKAAKETKMIESIFPAECPYTLEQCLNDTFYPKDS